MIVMLRRLVLVPALLLGTMGAALPAASQESGPVYSVGAGFEFSSGTYGSRLRTDTILVPVSIMVTPTPVTGISLEIPYIWQSNGNVTSSVAQGLPPAMAMQKRAQAPVPVMPAHRNMGGFGMPNGAAGAAAPVAVAGGGRGGLGDITLKGAYIAVREGAVMPQVKPMVAVKFPSADKDEALGTGAFDEGFTVELSKWFGNLQLFGETGYTFQGKSAGFALRDYLSWSAGGGYHLSEKVMPVFFLKGATPPADGATSLLEARLKLKYQATSTTGIDLYAARGITESSPDYGGGIAIYHDF